METKDATPPKRRRLFKRAAIATLIGGLVAGAGYNAFANSGGCGSWRGGGLACSAAEIDSHLDRMLAHLYIEIDATDAQKQRLDPIVKQAAKDLLPLRDRMRAARGKAMELLTADSVDRSAIEALRAEQLALAEQGSRRIAQAIADIAEVLTPEQRKEIAARIERHRHRWGRG